MIILFRKKFSIEGSVACATSSSPEIQKIKLWEKDKNKRNNQIDLLISEDVRNESTKNNHKFELSVWTNKTDFLEYRIEFNYSCGTNQTLNLKYDLPKLNNSYKKYLVNETIILPKKDM